MNIIADENLADLDDFEKLGNLTLAAGHKIDPQLVQQADILLVRSQTPVNAQLLDGSRIKFVGSATAGTNHIDHAYLNRHNITFADAAGTNAHAVVDYVIAALLELSTQTQQDWRHKTYGIVGMGHVGQELYKRLNACGLNIMVNDPPLESRQADVPWTFMPLDKLLTYCDVISLHTNLTTAEQSCTPSYRLLNKRNISQLKPDAWLINTSRGKVIDQIALLHLLAHNPNMQAVLDVYENEPQISQQLTDHLALATCHIAGYSQDAKMNASMMLYTALSTFYKMNAHSNTSQSDNPLTNIQALPPADCLNGYIKHAYDIRNDDQQLKAIVRLPHDKQIQAFYKFRKNYPLRRDFNTYSLNSVDTKFKESLANLGFCWSKS